MFAVDGAATGARRGAGSVDAAAARGETGSMSLDATCGTCTLCCKLLGVAELAKPEDAWCRHCDRGRGCRAYETRPKGCRDFACAWLVAREEGVQVDDALRPDRCGVVFHQPEGRPDTLVAHVDPRRERAWTEGAAMAHVAAMAGLGTSVAVRAAGRHYIVDREGVHVARPVARLPGGGTALERGHRIGRLL